MSVSDRWRPQFPARSGTHVARRAALSGTLRDVLNSADDAVGQLTIADTTLCDLLRDILQEAGGKTSGEMTTGRATDDLLALAKTDPSLLTSDVTDLLKRVKKAAEKRNKVVHAIARDRCIMCGQATQFEHRGALVDRSPAGVGLVTSEFTALINDGVKLAALISERLNVRQSAQAQALAVSTGNVQTPKQILIGQNWHHCAACSQTGVATAGVPLPTAVVVSLCFRRNLEEEQMRSLVADRMTSLEERLSSTWLDVLVR